MPGRVLPWLALAAGFAGWALHPPSNLDIDWYLLGARTLAADGGELYVTLRDPNPPSVWQLFLAVDWLARAVGVAPHRLFYALSALLAVGLLAWTARLLPERQRAPTLLAGALFGGFAAFAEAGQRDVLAALTMLPYLACVQRLSDGAAGQRWQRGLATFAAGLALLLKPPFLLYFLFAEALLLWRTRKVSTARRALPFLRADLLWAALAVALLAAASLAAHPSYLDHLASYGAFYLDWTPAALSSRTLAAILMLLAALALVAWTGRSGSWAETLGWAGLAALATALVQDKWWDYQAHPILLFAGLAWFAILAEPARFGTRALLWASTAAVMLWTGSVALQSARDQWRAFAEVPLPPEAVALAAAIDRLAPGQPVAILGSHSGAVAAYLSGTTWALADPPFWVIQQVGTRRLSGEALDAVEADAERRYLAELTARLEARPPALLAIHRGGPREPDALAYLRLDPRLAALLAEGYADAGETGGFALLLARP